MNEWMLIETISFFEIGKLRTITAKIIRTQQQRTNSFTSFFVLLVLFHAIYTIATIFFDAFWLIWNLTDLNVFVVISDICDKWATATAASKHCYNTQNAHTYKYAYACICRNERIGICEWYHRHYRQIQCDFRRKYFSIQCCYYGIRKCVFVIYRESEQGSSIANVV